MEFALDAAAGQVTFSYAPMVEYGGAVVYVFNRDRGEGVIATARDDGSVGPTAPFPAAVGEDIVVSFEIEDEVQSLCVRMQDGPSSDDQRCGL